MKLTEQEVEAIVWDDNPHLSVVERIEDSDIYKNYRNVAVVFSKHVGNGGIKYYMINYQEYTNHYGDGKHMYEDQEALEVKQIEQQITITKWVEVV